MPRDEQLFDLDVYHLGTKYSSDRSPHSDLGTGQCSNDDGLGTNEKADAQYEEFWGVQRRATSGEPSLHPFLWYVGFGVSDISTANWLYQAFTSPT